MIEKPKDFEEFEKIIFDNCSSTHYNETKIRELYDSMTGPQEPRSMSEAKEGEPILARLRYSGDMYSGRIGRRGNKSYGEIVFRTCDNRLMSLHLFDCYLPLPQVKNTGEAMIANPIRYAPVIHNSRNEEIVRNGDISMTEEGAWDCANELKHCGTPVLRVAKFKLKEVYNFTLTPCRRCGHTPIMNETCRKDRGWIVSCCKKSVYNIDYDAAIENWNKEQEKTDEQK